jgi:hypothetical protein
LDYYMTKLRCLALLLTLAPAAFADDYRVEVRGAFDRDLPAGDFVDDVDTMTLAGTWYMAPVSTDGVPLAEAAFLGRASYLSVIAARFEMRLADFNENLNARAASVGFYIPNTMFYAGAGISFGQSITGVSSMGLRKESYATWFGSLGVTPIDGLLVSTEFQEHGYVPNVSARYVGKLPNARFYAGGVSIVDPDQGDSSIGVDFDYYLDESSSLGAGYASGGDRIELRAEKFFSRSWAAGVSAYTADGGDGFGIQVKWRH